MSMALNQIRITTTTTRQQQNIEYVQWQITLFYQVRKVKREDRRRDGFSGEMSLK